MREGLIGAIIGFGIAFVVLQFSDCKGGGNSADTVERDTTKTLVFVPTREPAEGTTTPTDDGMVMVRIDYIDSLVSGWETDRHEKYRYRNERNDLRRLVSAAVESGDCSEVVKIYEKEIEAISGDLSDANGMIAQLSTEAGKLKAGLRKEYRNEFIDSSEQYKLTARVISQGFGIPKHAFSYDMQFYHVETSEKITKYKERKNTVIGMAGKDACSLAYFRNLNRIGIGTQAVYIDGKLTPLGGLRYDF